MKVKDENEEINQYEDLFIFNDELPNDENDELNDLTFKDVEVAEFDYAGNTQNFIQSLHDHSKDFCQEKILQEPNSIQIKQIVNKPITLEELEAQLHSAYLVNEPERQDRQMAATKERTDQRSQKFALLCKKREKYAGLMTKSEKELMAKIQMKQLTGENKFLNDYYFSIYKQKHPTSLDMKATVNESSTESSIIASVSLFTVGSNPSVNEMGDENNKKEITKERTLKIPTNQSLQKQKTKKKLSDKALETALGKASVISIRNPRKVMKQQPIITFTNPSNHSSSSVLIDSPAVHLRVLSSIENLYSLLLQIEELQAIKSSNYEEETILKKGEIIKELQLDREQCIEEMSKDDLIRMIQFLTFQKGKKIIGRINEYLNKQDSLKFLKKILHSIEYFDVIQPTAKVAEVNIFINMVISPFIEHINACTLDEICELFKILIDKYSLSLILTSKIGLVIFCILFSRLESLKVDENSNLIGDSLEVIWSCLEGNFLDLFGNKADISCGINSLPIECGDVEVEYYAWQFYAFLAHNISSEQRKSLVYELREKIISIVKEKMKDSIENLNIFLNALGLDASQIKV